MRHQRFGVAPAIAYWCDACFVNTSVVLDRAVSGTVTGSLAQVLSHLLESHNYFIKNAGNRNRGDCHRLAT
jgi:hypothetical protein